MAIVDVKYVTFDVKFTFSKSSMLRGVADDSTWDDSTATSTVILFAAADDFDVPSVLVSSSSVKSIFCENNYMFTY